MIRTHLLTLSWDDGFAKSFTGIAKIHDEYKLRASLNVIAQACTPGAYTPADEWHNAPTGSWELWNELASHGHEIGPHSWSHQNHKAIPIEEARSEIDRCLDAFERKLFGFKRGNAVYAMPFNASSEPVERHLARTVRAFRTGGPGVNPLPTADTVKLTCDSFGPGNCEAHLDECVDKWLKEKSGWLIYNTHGLDEEGWGPVTPGYVRKLYDRLLKLPHVGIVAPMEALRGV